MSQVLERNQTGYRIPVRHRTPTVERTLIAVGALIALVGAYLQLAPAGWWPTGLTEGAYLGSYMVGGLLLAAGFGVAADRASEEDGRGSARAITSATLAVIALIGVVVAALVFAL